MFGLARNTKIASNVKTWNFPVLTDGDFLSVMSRVNNKYCFSKSFSISSHFVTLSLLLIETFPEIKIMSNSFIKNEVSQT